VELRDAHDRAVERRRQCLALQAAHSAATHVT
jgi:hypothetical protein